jgi:hypothetical protein
MRSFGERPVDRRTLHARQVAPRPGAARASQGVRRAPGCAPRTYGVAMRPRCLPRDPAGSVAPRWPSRRAAAPLRDGPRTAPASVEKQRRRGCSRLPCVSATVGWCAQSLPRCCFRLRLSCESPPRRGKVALRLTLLSRVDAEQRPPRAVQRPGEGRRCPRSDSHLSRAAAGHRGRCRANRSRLRWRNRRGATSRSTACDPPSREISRGETGSRSPAGLMRQPRLDAVVSADVHGTPAPDETRSSGAPPSPHPLFWKASVSPNTCANFRSATTEVERHAVLPSAAIMTSGSALEKFGNR